MNSKVSLTLTNCVFKLLVLVGLLGGLTHLGGNATAGTLTYTVEPVPQETPFDLTALGTSDWAHWGRGGSYPSFDHKATGGNQISDVTLIGPGTMNAFPTSPRPISWTDGTPTLSVSSNGGFYFTTTQDSGYSFTVPASPVERTLYVLVGGYDTTDQLDAVLSDDSAPPITDVQIVPAGQNANLYAITYKADSPGQTLTITYKKISESNGASLDFKAAWLVGGAAPLSAFISDPVNSQSYNAPANVQITAGVSGGSEPITVEFYVDGNLIGTDNSSPYSLTYNNAPIGDHMLQIVATDSSSASSTSAPVSIRVIGSGGAITSTVAPSGNTDSFDLTALGASGDWAHWGLGGVPGSFDQKATGGSQISDITTLNGGPPGATIDSTSPLASWSDGMPNASATDDAGYASVTAIGDFESFTVPADTNTRTLSVLVGGVRNGDFANEGTLRAHLSDFSTADYVDVQTGDPVFWNLYKITYHAASAGQTLTINYTKSGGVFGPSAVKAAWLVNGTPPSVAITSPANSAGFIGNPASVAITATATDAGGSVTNVEFFADGNSIGTGGTGPDYSLTWNGATPGNHTLTARAMDNDGITTVSLPVSIEVATGGGQLGGNATAAAFGDHFDLTVLGTIDWAHWGLAGSYPSFDQKVSGGSQISDITPIGNVQGFANPGGYDARFASWTDGTPTPSVTDDVGFVFVTAVGDGFSFTAPADATVRTLYFLGGGFGTTTRIQAVLSDSSALPFVDTRGNLGANYQNVYAISYGAASAGQTLTVTITKTAGDSGASVDLKAAWLVLGAPLQFLPPVLSGGQITLNWTGTGQLEWAPTVLGPWAAVTPAPTPPYSEASVPDGSRFYRLKSVP